MQNTYLFLNTHTTDGRVTTDHGWNIDLARSLGEEYPAIKKTTILKKNKTKKKRCFLCHIDNIFMHTAGNPDKYKETIQLIKMVVLQSTKQDDELKCPRGWWGEEYKSRVFACKPAPETAGHTAKNSNVQRLYVDNEEKKHMQDTSVKVQLWPCCTGGISWAGHQPCQTCQTKI